MQPTTLWHYLCEYRSYAAELKSRPDSKQVSSLLFLDLFSPLQLDNGHFIIYY